MPTSDILRILAKFRAALLAQDEATLRQVLAAYRLMYDRLGGRIDALVLAAGNVENLTGAQLIRLSQYKALEKQLTEELARFGIVLESHVTSAAQAALLSGDADAIALLRILTGIAPVRVGFAGMNWGAIQTMIGFLQADSPLYTSIKALAPFYTDEVMKALIAGIGLGDSPRITAAKLAGAFESALGRGLTDALRITRTAQLYSYREAARANYAANSDVVTGWYWIADMEGDPEPCLSCIAQNGTRHELDESLSDHDNGRCAMVPEVLGNNPIDNMQTGEDWFNGLSEDQQRSIMGPGKFDAWQAGKFDFGQLSRLQDHPTWGQVWSETPLKDLVGESE